MYVSRYQNHAGQSTNIKTANKCTENIAEYKQNINQIEDDIGKGMSSGNLCTVKHSEHSELHTRTKSQNMLP